MSEIYESGKVLGEYLLFHYGQAQELLPDSCSWPVGMHEALGFPVRTVAYFSEKRVERGLDIGCAVGRSTFEMARQCEQVIGIDFSHAFIDAANALRRGEVLSYERLEEASLKTQASVQLPGGIDASGVEFHHGDAMSLPESLGVFDRVHAANLLCRLPVPARLLERLPSLLKSGGELVLATPCTWLEEFTPVGNWPSGSTMDWLVKSLEAHFDLVKKSDEPFLIRETARKFQWSSSLVTVWRRH